MASWHQQKAGIPILNHQAKWRSYNPKGHLSIMTHESLDACMQYCRKTGDIPLAPLNQNK